MKRTVEATTKLVVEASSKAAFEYACKVIQSGSIIHSYGLAGVHGKLTINDDRKATMKIVDQKKLSKRKQEAAKREYWNRACYSFSHLEARMTLLLDTLTSEQLKKVCRICDIEVEA